VSTETGEIPCANAECRVSQTGKCVEGLALDKCPHIARAAAGAQAVVADDKTETADPTPEIPLAKSETPVAGRRIGGHAGGFQRESLGLSDRRPRERRA